MIGKESTRDLVVVCGIGRSGTSLMHVLLSAHPGISGLPETGLLRNGAIAPVPRTSDAYSRLHRAGIEAAYLGSHSPLSLYEKLLEERSSSMVVVDKDPRLIEWLPVLDALPFTIRVIVLVRDPRGVVASKRRADWSSSQSTPRMLFAAEVQAALCYDYLATRPERVRLVSYEELVQQPRRTLGRLLGWIGVNPEPEKSLSAMRETAESLVASEEVQWKARLFKPIDAGRITAWKSDLTESQAKMVLALSPWQIRMRSFLSGDPYWESRPSIDNEFAVLTRLFQIPVLGFRWWRKRQHGIALKRLAKTFEG